MTPPTSQHVASGSLIPPQFSLHVIPADAAPPLKDIAGHAFCTFNLCLPQRVLPPRPNNLCPVGLVQPADLLTPDCCQPSTAAFAAAPCLVALWFHGVRLVSQKDWFRDFIPAVFALYHLRQHATTPVLPFLPFGGLTFGLDFRWFSFPTVQ